MDDFDAKIGTPLDAKWKQVKKNITEQILNLEIELELARNSEKLAIEKNKAE